MPISAFARHLPDACAPLLNGAIFFETPQGIIRFSADGDKDHATVTARDMTAEANGTTDEVLIFFKNKTAEKSRIIDMQGPICTTKITFFSDEYRSL